MFIFKSTCRIKTISVLMNLNKMKNNIKPSINLSDYAERGKTAHILLFVKSKNKTPLIPLILRLVGNMVFGSSAKSNKLYDQSGKKSGREKKIVEKAQTLIVIKIIFQAKAFNEVCFCVRTKTFRRFLTKQH